MCMFMYMYTIVARKEALATKYMILKNISKSQNQGTSLLTCTRLRSRLSSCLYPIFASSASSPATVVPFCSFSSVVMVLISFSTVVVVVSCSLLPSRVVPTMTSVVLKGGTQSPSKGEQCEGLGNDR